MKIKLKSSKMWAAVVGVAIGLCVIFGVDADTVEVVSGAVISAASAIAYIITEGAIDRAAVNDTEECSEQ